MVMIIWRKMYTKMQCPTGLDIVLTVFMRFSLLCVIPHMCSGVLWARAWRVCVRVSPRMSSVYGLAAGASRFDTLPALPEQRDSQCCPRAHSAPSAHQIKMEALGVHVQRPCAFPCSRLWVPVEEWRCVVCVEFECIWEGQRVCLGAL